MLLRSNEELQTWTQNENDHIDCVTNESNTEQLENVFEIDIQVSKWNNSVDYMPK